MSTNDFMNTDIEIVMFGPEAQMFGPEAQVIGLSDEGLSRRKNRLSSMVELLVWERYIHTHTHRDTHTHTHTVTHTHTHTP